MSVDPIARGLASKVRNEAIKSANTQALISAIRNNGFHPRGAATLAPADVPTLTLGANGAVSSINGAAPTAPAVARADARLTYVSGIPVQSGTAYPRYNYYTSRGAYYGAIDGAANPLRATGYFAYEFQHTGTVFEIPVYGSLGGAGVNLRLLVNGRAAATAAIPNATGGLYYLRVEFPSAATRSLRVETWGIPCNGVHVANASEIASTGRSYPLVTLIGDSFHEGSGAEIGDMQSLVLARALGFNAALAAVGGTGLLQPGGSNTAGYPKVAWTDPNRLTDLTLAGVSGAQDGAAADPRLGLVFASLNDQGLASSYFTPYAPTLQGAIANRADALIDAWVSARPGKPLVLFGPVWPSGQPNNRPTLDIYRIRDGIAEAAWGRANDNVWFIDRMMPSKREGVYSTAGDQASLYTGGTTGTDSVHPTPAGHRFDGLVDATALRRLIMSEFA